MSIGGTASDLPRLLACAASAALPQSRSSSVHSEAGDVRHAERELAALEGRYDDLPEVLHKYLRAPDMREVLPELAVAYDFATGKARVLGSGIRRAYGTLGPTEIAGTIDLVILGWGWALVVDYKGHQPGDVEAQLLLGAAAVSAIYNGDIATLVIPESGRPTHTSVDWAELEVFRQRLTRLPSAIAQARDTIAVGRVPSTNEGTHCRYCPAQDHCPARNALLKRMVSGDELTTVEMMSPLDKATAPTAYRMLRSMEAMVARVRAHVHAHAAEQPIDLGDGLVFGPHETKGNEQLDGDIVYQVARELHGQAFADAAVERSATKTAIKAAAKASSLPVTATERALLEAVRAAGGVTRKPSTRTEEYRLTLPEAARV